MLSPYRVLDLTDERGLLCGKILADLGADVIQLESPAGNPARRVGPFYRGETHPERSLYWWAYAANKRGVTLDVATTDGRALLTRLVEKADFLIESGAPGALRRSGSAGTRSSRSTPRSSWRRSLPSVRPVPALDTGRPTSPAWRWPASCT
jgi:crotonobetainyl-CoA:carnitine CoA-transferase CaiB-like acyl-CoA transferase